MRYKPLTDLGGFLWWIIVKFCKTELGEEQKQENWARNFTFFNYYRSFASLDSESIILITLLKTESLS